MLRTPQTKRTWDSRTPNSSTYSNDLRKNKSQLSQSWELTREIRFKTLRTARIRTHQRQYYRETILLMISRRQKSLESLPSTISIRVPQIQLHYYPREQAIQLIPEVFQAHVALLARVAWSWSRNWTLQSQSITMRLKLIVMGPLSRHLSQI